MLATLNDYVKAKAITSIVKYHRHLGGRESDWVQATAFAYREFRNASPAVIEALVRMARAATIAAAVQTGLKAGECLQPDCIPGIEE